MLFSRFPLDENKCCYTIMYIKELQTFLQYEMQLKTINSFILSVQFNTVADEHYHECTTVVRYKK
jgi:hypothetical protein